MVLDHRVGLEHVGADLAAPFDLLELALDLAHLLLALLFLQFGQPRTQPDEAHLLVLDLAALVLALDHDAGGQVGDAHGGVGSVDVLAAGAGGAVGVDAQILGANLDLPVVLDDGADVQRRKRRVPPRVGVEGGDAHQAVHAALAFQIAVGVVAGDLEGHRLDARLVAVQQVQQLHREAHPLGEAGVHAVEHLGPVLGLGAARARVQREDAVAVVVLAGQQRLEPQGLQVALQAFKLGPDLVHAALVVGLLRKLHQHLDVVRPGNQAFIVLDAVLHRAGLRGHLLCPLRIVPEARGAHVLVVLDQLLPQVVDLQGFSRLREHVAHGV